MSAVIEDRIATFQGQLVLERVPWTTYDRLLHDAEAAGRRLRITYDRGVLEIMTVSPDHERRKRCLARMIDVVTEEMAIPTSSVGSWTLRRERLDRGLEPDDCYYVQNERLVRGKESLDPEFDPPPDLAVEVEISRSVVGRMPIYAALRVPEVWRCDPEGRIHVHVLRGRDYVRSASSRGFPFVDMREFQRFYDRRNDSDETTWIRSFRKWVRSACARGTRRKPPKR